MSTSTAPSIAFVVLSDGLGKWRKGDVVSSTVLREATGDIARLLSLKAIREATVHEAGNAHVEIVAPERHLSYEHQLSAKDAEIARLTERVSSLEEQLAAGQHLKQPALSALNESALIEEKDRAIKTLEARVTGLTQELATARAEAAGLRSELVLARAEVGAAKTQAADAARDQAEKAEKEEKKPEAKSGEKPGEKAKKADKKDAAPAPAPAPEAPQADQPGLSRIRRVA